ncbi:MAG: hypothetical protein ETSY1_31210 [Candidatus Entotheonella factor]|uniref:Uncharacterized protein n=1 Tax=Entotheonella factor TaxID=1429438 RepID=W4LB77_ENTF1|nr:MAG: hypothetical protein ETSY1_31210 [Candidatus Entotheonella factor]
MARVLPGTAPRIVSPSQPEYTSATAWIAAHYEALRGQWVAVLLAEPALVASAP